MPPLEVVSLAILSDTASVVEWSARAASNTRNSKEGPDELIYIICLQVSPRPPVRVVITDSVVTSLFSSLLQVFTLLMAVSAFPADPFRLL